MQVKGDGDWDLKIFKLSAVNAAVKSCMGAMSA